MSSRRSSLAHVGALLVLILGIFFVIYRADTSKELPAPTQSPTTTAVPVTVASSSGAIPLATTTSQTTAVKKVPEIGSSTSTAKRVIKASIQATKSVATSSPNDILRIENPYSTPPLSFESVNVSARAALVNIFCSTKSSGALQPITGSGIVVDPRGIVLTNAHVAQYVLISQSERTDLHCEVRTGAPAVSKWVPVVEYIPAVWVDTHAPDITKQHALGTGEHDYALLSIKSTVDGSPLPPSFAYVSPDSREAIGFVDDDVLAASYPVEFVGGSVIQANLFPVSSITTIKQLLTFSVGTADVVSLGGIIGAQSGSSGGGVVNQWNRLVGLITTTSEGATTGERDLHAVTTGYINRDLFTQTGLGLTATLAKDPHTAADAFAPEAAILSQKLIESIVGH